MCHFLEFQEVCEAGGGVCDQVQVPGDGAQRHLESEYSKYPTTFKFQTFKDAEHVFMCPVM